MRIERRKKAELLSDLKEQWEYANNTSYDKSFRTNQLVEMIDNITYLLYYGNQLSVDENYYLRCLIRAVSRVLVEKSPENKKAVISALNQYAWAN